MVRKNFSDFVCERVLSRYTYGYIMTEKMPDTMSLSQWFQSYDISQKEVENVFLVLLFQIALSCRTMYLARMTHNDLHAGNILIRKHNEKQKTFIYYLQDDKKSRKGYTLSCKHSAHIFDFDRSFMEGVNNPVLERTLQFSQSNDVISPRDFIRTLVYLLIDYEEIPYYEELTASEGVTDELINKIVYVIYPDSLGIEEKYKKFDRFFRYANKQLYKRVDDENGVESILLDDGKAERFNLVPTNSQDDYSDFDSYDNIIDKLYRLIDQKHKMTNEDIVDMKYDLYFNYSTFFDKDGNMIESEIERAKVSDTKMFIKKIVMKESMNQK
jgi:hypothetical protein